MSVSRTPRKKKSFLSPRSHRSTAGALAPSAPRSRALIERLEERRLFTTLVGDDIFVYRDSAGIDFTITVGPGIVAEFIAATGTGTTANLSNLAGLHNGVPVNGGLGGNNADLYAIYVLQSNLDSFISVVANTGPFGGQIAPLNVTGFTGQTTTVAPAPNTGKGYLGARSENNTPIVNAQVTQPFGNLPPELTALRPGLIVEDGNNLGTFIFDGVVTGIVDIGGSMQKFHAGWILTGDASGIPSGNVATPTPSINVPNNFNVDGDIRSITSVGSFGTSTLTGAGPAPYLSGFDLQVGGRAGQILTRDSFLGGVDVLNLQNELGLTTAYQEVESYIGDVALGDVTDPDINNDTFDRPQLLGTYQAVDGGEFITDVGGALESDAGDQADYYGIALLGGQRLIVDIDSDALGEVNVGIFDPDGRLVNSDYTNNFIDFEASFETPIGYTADRPGVYRIAVGVAGDVTFTGGNPVGTVNYSIQISGRRNATENNFAIPTDLGDIALAGIEAVNGIRGLNEETAAVSDGALRVRDGDFGAVLSSAGNVLSQTPGGIQVGGVFVENAVERRGQGNLRVVDAISVGTVSTTETGAQAGLRLNIRDEVPEDDNPAAPRVNRAGNVGLIRGRGTPAEEPGDPAVGGDVAVYSLTDATGAPIAISGNFQIISAATTFLGQLFADKGIGVLRAGDMATLRPSIISVDADGQGADGIIDLIEVKGDFGVLGPGGPAIATGFGGNIRYMQLDGDIYYDRQFQATEVVPFNYSAGEVATVVDDSGSRIILTPIGRVTRNLLFDPSRPEGPDNPRGIGPTLAVTTYPIRSGGSVLVDVTSTGGLAVEGTGAFAEVSRAEVRGVGRPVINFAELEEDVRPLPVPGIDNFFTGDPLDLVVAPPEPEDEAGEGEETPRVDLRDTNLELIVTSDGGIVDVFNVVVVRSEEDFEPLNNNVELGNATAIRNETRGEIVNVVAESIIDLSARGTLGLARSTTGAAIIRQDVLQMTDELWGDEERPPRVVRPQSGEPVFVGDTFPYEGQTTGIMAIGGNILSISAGEAVGPVIIHGSIGYVQANADGNDLPGFEGIAAPITALNLEELEEVEGAGRIQYGVNIGEGLAASGAGTFSRAGLYAAGRIGPISNQGLLSDIRGDIVSLEEIDRITLNDGAIINADILVVTDFLQSREILIGGFIIPNDIDPVTSPDLEISGIELNGRGGILSALILGSDVGNISVNGGFGIISTMVGTLGDSVLGSVQTDGYGIRRSWLTAGARMGQVSARGDGSSSSILRYTPSVRQSETPGLVDPFFDIAPTAFTDLYLALGTTPGQPEVAGITETGIIEGSELSSGGNLTGLSAYSIRRDADGFNSTLRFPQTVGDITTRGPINGMSLTAGRLNRFRPASDVFNTDITVAGRVASMRINGNFAEDSFIALTGPNGKLKNLFVDGNFDGEIVSSGRIGSVVVTGDISGSITANLGAARRTSISKIQFRDVAEGAELIVNGYANTIIATNNLGGASERVTINGSANKIRVHGILQAIVTVTDDLRVLDVRDSIINSRVGIGDTLGLLKVANNIDADSIVQARVLQRQKIGGQVFGQIIITG